MRISPRTHAAQLVLRRHCDHWIRGPAGLESRDWARLSEPGLASRGYTWGHNWFGAHRPRQQQNAVGGQRGRAGKCRDERERERASGRVGKWVGSRSDWARTTGSWKCLCYPPAQNPSGGGSDDCDFQFLQAQAQLAPKTRPKDSPDGGLMQNKDKIKF